MAKKAMTEKEMIKILAENGIDISKGEEAKEDLLKRLKITGEYLEKEAHEANLDEFSLFLYVDKDKDAKINKAETVEALNCTKYPSKKEDVEAQFDIEDKDHDGLIDIVEFYKVKNALDD